MPVNFQTRSDGSSFLVIDGDLQFDSRDERIYHETLVLPTVSLARLRKPGNLLRILVCGGGDGLVAREILKYSDVVHIDLYDYDSALSIWPKTSSLN
jgi:spermidine synthase